MLKMQEYTLYYIILSSKIKYFLIQKNANSQIMLFE